jgi:isopenicillin N synthase-like dioxygenase
MMTMPSIAAADGVATLSLANAARDEAGFARALGKAFERHGFAIVSDHGIESAVIARADAAARAFFAQPDAAKRRWHDPAGGGQRGYTPFGIEAAKGAAAVDAKEFWHVGRDLPEGHPLGWAMPPNVWPDVAGFRAATLDLYAALEAAGLRLLRAIARHLGHPADHFDETVRDGNSVLRLLHYPPGGTQRAGAHEDINVITLLLGAEEAGLEMLDRQGRWLPVTPPPGALAVNVGDMLQRVTRGRMRSTTHRVAAPEAARAGAARYSMPFFLHFRPEVVVDPGPPAVTAHAYLAERLAEIGLAAA